MKFARKLALIFTALLLSGSVYSHCGVCGAGDAKDHKKKGENSEHHKYDDAYYKSKKSKSSNYQPSTISNSKGSEDKSMIKSRYKK